MSELRICRTLLLMAIWVPAVSFADGELPFRLGPAASATGRSGRAAVDPSEGAWLNPASLVHMQSYNVVFGHQQAASGSGGSYRDFSAMVSDGGPGKIAAGAVSYVMRDSLRGSNGQASEQRDLQVSLAAPIAGSHLSLGLTYRKFQHLESGLDRNQDAVTVGALWAPMPVLGFAAVVSNLGVSFDERASPETLVLPTAALAAHLRLYEMLHFRLDAVRALQKEGPNSDRLGRDNVHFGLETFIVPEFGFRGGAAWIESRDEFWWTAGVGFKGPRLSVGYAFEQDARSARGMRHTFDLWLSF